MNSHDAVAAAQAVLGENASEVVSALAGAVETLFQLEAMFSYLATDLSGDSPVPSRARVLAAAGQQMAGVAADLGRAQVAEYRAALAGAGMRR